MVGLRFGILGVSHGFVGLDIVAPFPGDFV